MEDYDHLLIGIKEELYKSIPSDRRPEKKEFEEAFRKSCCTSKILEIFNKIEETLQQ